MKYASFYTSIHKTKILRESNFDLTSKHFNTCSIKGNKIYLKNIGEISIVANPCINKCISVGLPEKVRI